MTYTAIYSRHHIIENEDFETLEEARLCIQWGNETEEMFGICILNKEENKAWLPKGYDEFPSKLVDYKKHIGDATIEGYYEDFPD